MHKEVDLRRSGIGEPVFLLTLLLAFVGAISFISFTTESFRPSAEARHIAAAHLHYRSANLFIRDSLETYQIGPASAYPFLFDLIEGKLLNIKISNLSTRSLLRSFNLLLGALFFIVATFFIGAASPNFAVRNVFLLLLVTNSALVLSFAGINAQNLCVLLCCSFFTSFVRFVQDKESGDLATLIFSLLLGCLVDVYFVALLVCALTVLLFFSRGALGDVVMSPSKLKTTLFTSLCVIVLMAIVYFYGRNYQSYGALTPSADRVLGADVAYKYFPDFRKRQDIITLRRGAESLGAKEFAQAELGLIGEQIFNSGADKAPKLIAGEFYLMSLVALPMLVGIATLARARLTKRSFNSQQFISNDAVRPMFFLVAIYLMFLIAQDYVAFRSSGIMSMDLYWGRFFPIFFGVIFLISHFSLAYARRKIARVLISILLVGVFAIPNLSRIVLHYRSSHTVETTGDRIERPAVL